MIQLHGKGLRTILTHHSALIVEHIHCMQGAVRLTYYSVSLYTISMQHPVWVWMNWQIFPSEVVLSWMRYNWRVSLRDLSLFCLRPCAGGRLFVQRMVSWPAGAAGAPLLFSSLEQPAASLRRAAPGRGFLTQLPVDRFTSRGPFWKILLPISSSSNRVW